MPATPNANADSIELLSPTLLDAERPIVEETARLSRALRISLGWHYLLDVAWTLRNLGAVPGNTVLDAGAGIGVTQWLLAERGVNVFSVDRTDRSLLSLRFRVRYRVRGAQPDDLRSARHAFVGDLRSGALAVDLLRNANGILANVRGSGPSAAVVTIHESGLDRIHPLPGASIDGIVSISSLEHNDPANLSAIVQELWRVLRPGGVLTATVGASRDRDWFHEPSKGWCLTEETVRRAFGIADTVISNYDRYDEIMAATRSNDELRRRLARSYSRSGNNGMPWGTWDPQYLSVGIRRVKPAAG